MTGSAPRSARVADTPVLIGVGQIGNRIDLPQYRALSPSDLAAEAARRALADAGGAPGLASRIDCIAATRTFEDSGAAEASFGKSSNFPRSIARRLGISPRRAVWAKAGGNSPQDLVSEFCGRVAAGEFEVVLLCGAEATSTVRHARRAGLALNFAEDPGGSVEDRGAGVDELLAPEGGPYGLNLPLVAYAAMENARRGRLGQSREEYALEMGRLFAPFAAAARANATRAWDVPEMSAADLVEISGSNRWISEPYPLRLVARDQVNLGAAVLIASRRVARELAVLPEKLVYLHGHARATEKPLLARPDLGASPAAVAAADEALKRAGTTVGNCRFFDFYSCFPIAVSNVAIDGLGLPPDDPRGLTITGGLPFFGGPGNNYSMHAIAEMVVRLRAAPAAAGLVGANGGFLSKYSVGIYSTVPREWRDWSDGQLQERIDAVSAVEVAREASGRFQVEAYTVLYRQGAPERAIVVARSQQGRRAVAQSAEGDVLTVEAAVAIDPIKRPVDIEAMPGSPNVFRFGS